MESPLPPEERQVLCWRHRRLVVATVAAQATALVVAIAAVTVVATHGGSAQHLLGFSERQRGVVTDTDEVLWCTRTNPHVHTVQWEEDGAQRVGTLETCRRHTKGDQVAFWVAGGELMGRPPTTHARVVVGVGITTLVLGGVLGLRALGRRRRACAAVLDGTWAPVVLATVGLPGGPNFQMSATGERLSPRTVRPLHVGHRTAHVAEQLPGTLYADRFRLLRPKGLCLHVASDGTRTWFTASRRPG